MKRLLLLLVFLAALLALSAGELDIPISEIFSYSSVTPYDGENTLIPDDYLDGEGSAYGFLAYAAYCFLYVHNGWDLLDSEDLTEAVEEVDAIGAIWLNGELEIYLKISLADLYDTYGPLDCDDMSNEELYAAVERYVEDTVFIDYW